MAYPHNTPIEITIKIDPAAVAGIARPIARVASSTWRVAITWCARHKRGLIAISSAGSGAICVFIVKGLMTGSTERAIAAGGKVFVVFAVGFAFFWLKNRFSPLIHD